MIVFIASARLSRPEYLEIIFLEGLGFDLIETGLQNLSANLIELNSLQELTLKFYCCHKITNEGRDSVSDARDKLTSLKKSYVKFSFLCFYTKSYYINCLIGEERNPIPRLIYPIMRGSF